MTRIPPWFHSLIISALSREGFRRGRGGDGVCDAVCDEGEERNAPRQQKGQSWVSFRVRRRSHFFHWTQALCLTFWYNLKAKTQTVVIAGVKGGEASVVEAPFLSLTLILPLTQSMIIPLHHQTSTHCRWPQKAPTKQNQALHLKS